MSGLPSSLLFACSQNSVRSPMAEALAKRLYGHSIFVDSVGVRASDVDSFAVAALDELGIERVAFEQDLAQIRRLTPGPVRRTIRRVPTLVTGVADAINQSGLGPRVRGWITREDRIT